MYRSRKIYTFRNATPNFSFPSFVSSDSTTFLLRYQPTNRDINSPPAGSIYFAETISKMLKNEFEYEDIIPRMITPTVTNRTLLFLDILYSSLI